MVSISQDAQFMNKPVYSGLEPGRPLGTISSNLHSTGFAVDIPTIPYGAHPIIDETNGECLGFTLEIATKVWRILDISGGPIGIEEAPLEEPLVAPYDLVLLTPAGLKFVRAGLAPIARLAAGQVSGSATARILGRIIPALRGRLRALSVGRLQFTETSARHMANPGRFVPVHILHLAIKYGRRMPDPQQIAGVFRYEIRMSRFVRRGDTYVRVSKILEVVVRESDWTILHFMYY